MIPPRVRDAALGLCAVAVGAVCAVRPFPSVPVLALVIAIGLIVAGVAEATCASAGNRVLPRLGAAALIVTGAILLGWQGLSIVAVAVVAGVGLIGWGVSRLVDAVRGTDRWSRISDALLGVAAIATAVAALAWPGVTVFAATFAAGIALVWFGLTRLYRAVRGDRRHRRRVHSAARLAAAVVAVAVAVPLAAVSVRAHQAAPTPDDFYSAAVDPGTPPGTLIRSEPFTRDLPPGAQAWRILYTTTRDEGRAATASALVVAPEDPPTGPRPVIAWAHGTTGVARGCAPSLLDEPFQAGATPALPQVIDSGSVLVATDYIGLGTPGPSPYVIGQGEARSVLDSVRAARTMRGLHLADETVVWGHSQGGHAALWTGILAPSYAPDVNVLGVAALAPAADLVGLATDLTTMTGGPLLAAYVVDAYARGYSEVHRADYLDVQARLPMRAMAARCLHEPAATVSVIEALLLGDDPYSQSPAQGPLGARLAQNTPSEKLSMPVFIAQGSDDPLINPQGQQRFAAAQCASGSTVEFSMYPGLDHLSIVAPDSPAVADLLSWTTGREKGAEPQSNCIS
ncbi:lipase family protein [Gordonia sp. HY002]|uniref:lipase family protein n=1 Tax=Gordonia zhenghanii TaxID=2911516 RepID=UPI001EF01D10|nr:lipase family protein [Gordonia zhenghanii]MCF8571210.1 lipase family protein [Gordonia zhenghanii]MCF8606452.1 lipase family protein [Gordonia zhenghanii]